MRLKVNNEIITVPDGGTVGDLKNALNIEILDLRAGFPPKQVDLNSDHVKLSDLNIRNLDKLSARIEGDTAPEPSKSENRYKPAVQETEIQSETSPQVRAGNDYLKLRIMDDDNSCLFRAVGYAIMRNLDTMFELRSIVANVITENPVEYNDAILGKKRQDYIKWILKENSWGGAIELNILARHFDVTICSLDVSTSRVDRFNPGAQSFIMVVYSGIHYDAVALTPVQDDSVQDLDQTVFQTDEQGLLVLDQLLELGKKLKSLHYYTDTSSFQIVCRTCGSQFIGEKEAVKHTTATGHSNFGEA